MKNTISKFGFYSAVIAFIATCGYGIVQILQIAGVIHYPLDDTLIYGFSLCIASPFLLSLIALHYSIPVEKKFWSHSAIAFATLYTGFVTFMYAIQLATVIPFTHSNAFNEILAVTPHSVFWAIDALGYICMGVASLFAAAIFEKNGKDKWVRLFFLFNGLFTPVIAFVYFYPHFSIPLLFIASPWIITASGCMLWLAFYFKRI